MSSNINRVVETACKLGTLWHDGNRETKRKIQNLVYPNGIYWDKAKRCYRTQNRNKFFDILDRYSISYGKEKGTSSSEDVPLCPIVTNYRTFVDDMYKVLQFAEWIRKSNDLCSDDIFATRNV